MNASNPTSNRKSHAKTSPRRWLLLLSNDYREDVREILIESGEGIMPIPPDWKARDGIFPIAPDVVAVDHNAGRLQFLQAGFWRGMGLPVVYFARRNHDASTDLEKLAAVAGFKVMRTLAYFRGWIAHKSPYLSIGPKAPRMIPNEEIEPAGVRENV